MTIRNMASALLVTGSLFAPTIQAEDFSVGGSFGVTTVDEFCDTFSGPGISCDDQGSTLKFFAGSDVNENFRIETFYANLGEVEAIDSVGDSVTVDADGIGFAAMPMAPVSDDVDLFGKVGLYMWDSTATAQISGATGTGSDDGTDPFFGFGGRFKANDKLSLRVEYEMFELDDVDADALTVGASVKF